MWNLSTRDFTRIVLLAAITAALGLIPPLAFSVLGGVPVTVQTLGVMLAGIVLGTRNSFLSISLLIFIVALGAPILPGGRGGLGVFFGPSAGFLLGWIPAAMATGWLFRALPISSALIRAIVAAMLGGIVVMYIFGIPVMAWRSGLSLDKAFFASLFFVPGDMLKAFAAGFIARTVQRWDTAVASADTDRTGVHRT